MNFRNFPVENQGELAIILTDILFAPANILRENDNQSPWFSTGKLQEIFRKFISSPPPPPTPSR